MAGYTEADYAVLYKRYARTSDGRRMAGYKGPENNWQPTTVVVPYHRTDYYQAKLRMAQLLIDQLGLTADSAVLIFGSGYNWLGEALIELCGCEAVGCDISDYIEATKGASQDQKVRDSITAGGLDPDSGLGAEVMARYQDSRPAALTTIEKENLSNTGSRNRAIRALSKSLTNIISEEVWQTFTQQERDTYTGWLNWYSVPVHHIIDGNITAGQ